MSVAPAAAVSVARLTLVFASVASAALADSAERLSAASEIVSTAAGPARRFYVAHLHAFTARCYGYIDITVDTVTYTPASGESAHGFAVPRGAVSTKVSAFTYPEVHLSLSGGVQKFIVVDREMVERTRSVAATRAHLKSPHLLATGIAEPALPVAQNADTPPAAAAAPSSTAPAVVDGPASATATAIDDFERGWQYRAGRGVPQDFSAAARWFEKATEAGSVRAQYELAVLHLYGMGIPQNANKARGLLYLAADRNYAPALRLLGLLELSDGNHARGLEHLAAAAELRDVHATFVAGITAYARRHEDARLWVRALTWLEKAARAGHPGAEQLAATAWLAAPWSVFVETPADLRPSRTVFVSFDELSASPTPVAPPAVDVYLAQFGLSTRDMSPGTSVLINDQRGIYSGQAVRATSGHNVFYQSGQNSAIRFALRFPMEVGQVRFSRVALIAGPSGITHPAWKATALDASGNPLESVSERYISSMTDVPARTFHFAASAIAAIRFESDGGGSAAFSSVMLDDLRFETP